MMVTLKDLAEKLDVSVSTVSKALNNSSEISENTKSRIKAVAKFYNYQPNKVAQNLKRKRTSTIGVVVPSTANRFFAKVLLGIEKEAASQKFNIIICLSNESIVKEKDSLQLLANGSVDGFIIAASEEAQLNNDFSHIKSIQNLNIPVVISIEF